MTLTLKQRLIGFGCCFGFGCLCTLLSMLMLWLVRITQVWGGDGGSCSCQPLYEGLPRGIVGTGQHHPSGSDQQECKPYNRALYSIFMAQLQLLTRIRPAPGPFNPVGPLWLEGQPLRRHSQPIQWLFPLVKHDPCPPSPSAFLISVLPPASYLPTTPSRQFAVLYSIGSVVSVMSTLFLMGPVKQCQRMFEEKRIFATITYVAAIAATLAVAFTTGSAILCFVMLIIQFLALIWWVHGGGLGARRVLRGSRDWPRALGVLFGTRQVWMGAGILEVRGYAKPVPCC